MTPAPAFDCAVCGRTIGKGTHILVGWPDVTGTDRIVCVRCMQDTKRLHGRFYPTCSVTWHDLHDHRSCSATRAAAAHVLGLWPERTAAHQRLLEGDPK